VQATEVRFKSSVLQGKYAQQVYIHVYLGYFASPRDLDVIYSRYGYIVGTD
jgi:nitrate reductase alpha subunit